MMKLLLIVALLFTGINDSQAASDTIVWGSYRLKASDFKGQSDTAVFANNHFALTVWKLTYFYRLVPKKQQAEIIAYTWFDGRKSWVRPSQATNQKLISHEQGHFDLAEILARRFKKQLSKTTFTKASYADSLQSIFADLLAETYSRQQDYDEDTQFGNDSSQQARWQTLISTELIQLEAWSGKQVFASIKN